MVRTTVRKQSARRDDTYEETVTDTEKRYRRTRSVSFSDDEMLYIERDRQGETPCGAGIVPDGGPMPPVLALPAPTIPRLRGDSTAEPDA